MARYETMYERRRLQNGATIWAYAFEETGNKESIYLHQKPVRGRLSFMNRAFTMGDNGPFAPDKTPRYFVPLRKDSNTECAWSKAVNLDARNYADTEEEAVEGYNECIESIISEYESKIKAFREMKI